MPKLVKDHKFVLTIEELDKVQQKKASLIKDDLPTTGGKETWTQEYLAKKACVSLSNAKRFLNRKHLGESSFRALIHALGFESNEFFALQSLNDVDNDIYNWHKVYYSQLENAKTQNIDLVIGNNRLFDNIAQTFVPLGLWEKTKADNKDLSCVGFEERKEHKYERYQITQIYECQRDFFEGIIHRELSEQKAENQRKKLAIIGETGAGKTTLLLQIGFALLKQNPDSAVIWISLKDVRDKNKSDVWDYILNEWIKKSGVSSDIWKQEFENKLKDGSVWLLLDGLEDISNRSLIAQFNGWLYKPHIAWTCRRSRWETDKTDFETLKYDIYECIGYGSDRTYGFIDAWFSENLEAANRLKSELKQTARERINDLIKHPLHLSLLCSIYEEDAPTTGFAKNRAELFEQFTRKQYRRKITNSRNYQPLVLSLGELAKEMIDTQKQLTRSQIEDNLSKDNFEKALELGWLKSIDQDEQYYDFLHDSFKEYFATLAIPHWKYFLPEDHIDRPVKDNNGKYKKYRIFEPKWKEVIIFWIGRKDEDIDKENFITALIDFEDGCQDFYGYRAYFLAAICLNEFKDCKFAEQIIDQMIEWSFGYFNDDKQEWCVYINSLDTESYKTVGKIHHSILVEKLNQLSQCDDIDDYTYFLIAETLGKVDIGNPNALAPLIQILRTSEGSSDIYRVGASLEKIAIGNQNAISMLGEILEDCTISIEIHKLVLEILAKISIENNNNNSIFENNLKPNKTNDIEGLLARLQLALLDLRGLMYNELQI